MHFDLAEYLSNMPFPSTFMKGINHTRGLINVSLQSNKLSEVQHLWQEPRRPSRGCSSRDIMHENGLLLRGMGGRLLLAQDSISIESELYMLLNLAKRNCVAYFSLHSHTL